MRTTSCNCITDTPIRNYIQQVLVYNRMQDIKNFLEKASAAIPNRHSQSVQAFLQVLQQEQAQTSLLGDIESKQMPAESSQLPPCIQDEQKVLQIDVIESNYIPRTEEQISHSPPEQPQNKKIEHVHKDKRSLELIESEKKAILEELRRIDEEIAIIKGEPAEDINLKRKEKEIQQEKARKQAKDLVKQLKREKKQLEDRKKKQHEKQLLILQQEQQALRQRRREEESRAKEERRKAIEQRMDEEKRKREERKLMDKQSNKLLMQLRREDEILKVKESIPAEINEVEQKKKVVQKRQDVNFREIEQHERRYIIMKEQEKVNRRDRSQSQSHPVPKYQKNTWIQKIEEEEFKRKEEEKLKEMQRKNQLEKRLKYGQLVKNIFLPKKKEESKLSSEQIPKPNTPNAPALPKIPESEKRVTQSKAMKNFTQQNRPFATAHNYKKPPRAPKVARQEKQQKESQPQMKEDQEKQKQRKQREMELRRQTKERLKKLQNQSLDLLPQSKPKYENYLGQVKLKRKDQNSWKDIIDNGKLSKEEKYTEMLKKANNLETRAKQKQEFRKDGDEEAVNLYIGSIQAKLALLQKF